MKAVVIGPGRVGLGFAGHLLHRSGYQICFVGRRRAVAPLMAAGKYVVRLTDGHRLHEDRVSGVSAIDISCSSEVEQAIADADVVCTAVGPRALDSVAPLLARGLSAAKQQVNVIAFENAEDAGRRLRRLVAEQVGFEHAGRHGFSGAVVSRVVAHRLPPERPGDPLVLIGEPHTEFAVDAAALNHPLPRIEGLVAVDDFTAFYRRKLYRYSAGHAATAYLGQLKGYRYLHAAIRDPEIAQLVRAAVREGQAGLRAAYGPHVAGDDAEVEAIIDRFGNAELGDTVARVGRDVPRKLGPSDRLLGAARLAEHAGVAPVRLAQAAAAALCFKDGGDPPVVAPREGTASGRSRVARLLSGIGHLPPTSPLARLIQNEWQGLMDGWEDGNLMLSLEDRLWAWSSNSHAPAGRLAS